MRCLALRTPEPKVWSALEYVVHLRAALGFYADRIRRTLAEDRPRLTAYGFGAACERDNYNGEEPNTAIAGLRSAAGGREAGFDDVVRYLEATARRARRLQAGSPWPVHELDADAGPDALLQHALGRA